MCLFLEAGIPIFQGASFRRACHHRRNRTFIAATHYRSLAWAAAVPGREDRNLATEWARQGLLREIRALPVLKIDFVAHGSLVKLATNDANVGRLYGADVLLVLRYERLMIRH